MLYKNPLSDLNVKEKSEKYNIDSKNPLMMAYSEGHLSHLLSDFKLEQVDFIGGIWRVQKDFPYEIKKIHDKEFVLGDRINVSDLPKKEISIYKYYRAAKFWPYCYGFNLGEFDHIIANSGNSWAYGDNIDMARSKLSVQGMENLIKNPMTRWIVELMFSRMK